MKKTGTLIAGLAVAGLVTLPALGQYQLGDGRALDGNLRAGGSGVNDYKAANTAGQAAEAIVTGGAARGANFRGLINYGPTGAFRDALSTDTLQRFEQDAAKLFPSSRAKSPYEIFETSKAPNPLYSPEAIYQQPGSGVSIGDVSGQRPAYGSGGGVQRLEPTLLGIRPPASERLNLSPQRLGVAAGQDGRVLEINSSPLTGVTIRDPSTYAQRAEQGNVGIPLPAAGVGQGAAQFGTVPAPVAPVAPTGNQLPDASLYQDARVDALVEGTKPNERAAVSGLVEPPLADLGLRFGQHMRSTDKSAARQLLALNESSIDHSLFGMLGNSSAQPGQDVYLDLLRKIRGDDAKDTATAGNQAVPIPALPQDAPKPDDKPDATATNLPDRPLQDPVDVALRRLDYDMKPLESLAGSASTALNNALRNAETQMGSQKYFEAEEAYSQALMLNPGNPLSQVGRVHAQLGAGLYRTAAYNLRGLLTHHPEMIAARYAEPLLPPVDRLSKIRHDLEGLLESSRRSDEALLLAYLAYQQGRAPDVAHLLQVMLTRSPNDPLVPLLHRIWVVDAHNAGKDEPSLLDEPTTKPAPTDEDAANPSNEK